MSLRSLLLIASREFLSHLRTRSFVFGVLVTPMLLLAVIRLPSGTSDPAPVMIALVDLSGTTTVDMIKALGEHADQGGQRLSPAAGLVVSSPVDASVAIREADHAAADGQCDIVVVIPEAFHTEKIIQVRTPQGRQLAASIKATLLAAGDRAAARSVARGDGVSASTRTRLSKQPELQHQPSGLAPSQPSGLESVLQGLGFVILLYLTTLAMSHALLTSVIEEKSSRVVELLLSAVSPVELMAGKIAGIGMLGLSLVAVWVGLGWATAASSSSSVQIAPRIVVGFCVFFVLGFLLYAAILAGVGASVGSLKEAQHLVAPVTIVMMIPVLLWWRVHRDPDGLVAMALSWFPPTTPITMMNRLASPSPPTLTELSLCVLWMMLAICVATVLAAKLFRIGILSQGAPPRFGTLLRRLGFRS